LSEARQCLHNISFQVAIFKTALKINKKEHD